MLFWSWKLELKQRKVVWFMLICIYAWTVNTKPKNVYESFEKMPNGRISEIYPMTFAKKFLGLSKISNWGMHSLTQPIHSATRSSIGGTWGKLYRFEILHSPIRHCNLFDGSFKNFYGSNHVKTPNLEMLYQWSKNTAKFL